MDNVGIVHDGGEGVVRDKQLQDIVELEQAPRVVEFSEEEEGGMTELHLEWLVEVS